MTLHVFNGAFGIKHVNSFINMKLNPPHLIKFEIEILINIHTKKIQSSMKIIKNGSRTEWSSIRCVIIRVIVNHS